VVVAIAVLANRYAAPELSGRPRVVDGDSLAFGADRVRLYGIDAPELAQTCDRDGATVACGRMARAHLRNLAGESTKCVGVGIDRYDRILARCQSGGNDLNAAMVRDGWAVDAGEYAAEEQLARRGRSGLWAMRFDSPQAWREAHPRPADAEAGPRLTASIRAVLMAVRNWLGW